MNNINNINPAEFTNLFSTINEIIKKYLLNNVFTVDLMQIETINEDKTVNIKSILNNIDTQGNTLINNSTINNINVLTIKAGKSSISFTSEIGDIGLYISLKKNYSNYFSGKNNITTNNNLFNISNGVFIPLQLNNISEYLIISNGNSSISINDNEININSSTININAETNINNNCNISQNCNITGNCEATTYSTGGVLGVSGVFVDTPTNKQLTITNGLITAIS